ncbi:MAG: SMI1/KNR4 family protein [Planctomycetaceae bacterium]
MPDDPLQQLEKLIGHPLPADYLQLLRNYPDALRAARRCIDNTDAEGTVADVDLIADPQSLLEINLEPRQDSVPAPDGMEEFWPDQMLVIGETGGGDYYCLDVFEEVAGVIQYDHQSVGFYVIADSLDEFVQMLMDTYSDDDAS